MPQMATLSWFGLFILFILTFMLFSALNYFNYSVAPTVSSRDKEAPGSTPLNWSW